MFIQIAYITACVAVDVLPTLVIKVEKLDLPLKRNQAFIVTHFSKTREKFCGHLLGEGEEKRQTRMELLIKVTTIHHS